MIISRFNRVVQDRQMHRLSITCHFLFIFMIFSSLLPFVPCRPKQRHASFHNRISSGIYVCAWGNSSGRLVLRSWPEKMRAAANTIEHRAEIKIKKRKRDQGHHSTAVDLHHLPP